MSQDVLPRTIANDDLGNLPTWPHYAEDEIAAVVEVLRSGRVNYWNGDIIQQFEHDFARAHDCHYGIALSNGTVALELCLRTLGIGPGDEVIVPCRTFIGTASAVVQVGATPVVADVDPHSQNISPEAIRLLITPQTKAIIAVHLAGWPCEMAEILDIANEFDLKVVEDCAQAHGARYRDRAVGSFGDMAAFSFCTNKIMSTGGEGGMVVTNSRPLWLKAWSYKDHGKDFDATRTGSTRFVHYDFGSNLRMTAMQAAIGLAQLAKLPDWVAIRRTYANILHHYTAQVPILTAFQPPRHARHSYYKFDVFTRTLTEREAIFERLRAIGYPVTRGISPDISQERAFQSRGWQARRPLTHAARLGETCLSLEVHPTLREQDLHHLGLALLRIAKECASHA